MLRSASTISKDHTVIQDPVMEPFFITKTQNSGYTVFERVQKGSSDKEYVKTVAYPATFNAALKRVITELVNSKGDKHFNSLQDYLAEWRELNDQVSKLTTMEL